MRRVQTASRTLIRYTLCPFDHVLRPDLIAFLLKFGHLRYSKVRCLWTSGSTGTEMSGRDLIGELLLHRLIDFAASELESYHKGCRQQQGWKPAKSRSFLQRFGRSERISFLIDKTANALHSGQLVRPVSTPLIPYRYKLSIYYWRSNVSRTPARTFATGTRGLKPRWPICRSSLG